MRFKICLLFTNFIFLYIKPDIFFDNKFVIVIPSYNNSLYYKQNLDSIFKQEYQNYRIIYIDDCSTDGTADLVEKHIKECNQEFRSTLIKNKKRQLALANIYSTILSCEDDEIIVMVDGDDQLSHEKVLNIINETYNNEDVWITYGNYKYLSNGQPCEWDPTFPEYIVNQNNFRDFPHGLTHLRTFYVWLFKQIKMEDLFFEGSFYKMCSDVAIYIPMIEMAGKHFKFFKDTFLYTYNDLNILNDHKVSEKMQRFLNVVIRQKNKYLPLMQKRSFKDIQESNKIDLITFPELKNVKQLFETIRNKIKNLNKVLIIYETINEKDESIYNELKNIYTEFNFIEKNSINSNLLQNILMDLFENYSKFIMFLDSDIIINKDLDCSGLIKSLDLTKSCALLFGNKNNISLNITSNNVEVIKNNYAFNLEKSKQCSSIKMAVYNKKNINLNDFESVEKLEMNWKFIAENKICLFSFFEFEN